MWGFSSQVRETWYLQQCTKWQFHPPKTYLNNGEFMKTNICGFRMIGSCIKRDSNLLYPLTSLACRFPVSARHAWSPEGSIWSLITTHSLFAYVSCFQRVCFSGFPNEKSARHFECLSFQPFSEAYPSVGWNEISTWYIMIHPCSGQHWAQS